MFGLSNNWSWLLLLLVLGVIFVVGKYMQKGVESPHKERIGLRYAFIMLVIAIAFFYVNLPILVYYVPDPGEIKTLDQAINRIERQEAKLGKLYENLNDIKYSFVYFLLILGMLIGSIRDYSRALSDEDVLDEDAGKMISIFDEDKNNGK